MDLRIGNKVTLAHESNEPIVTIKELDNEHATFKETWLFSRTYDLILPIALTPEWLEKCGFVKDGFTWNLGLLSICMPEDGGYKNGRLYFNAWFIIEPPKYLHQLQNIYYCLYSQELNITL